MEFGAIWYRDPSTLLSTLMNGLHESSYHAVVATNFSMYPSIGYRLHPLLLPTDYNDACIYTIILCFFHHYHPGSPIVTLASQTPFSSWDLQKKEEKISVQNSKRGAVGICDTKSLYVYSLYNELPAHDQGLYGHVLAVRHPCTQMFFPLHKKSFCLGFWVIPVQNPVLYGKFILPNLYKRKLITQMRFIIWKLYVTFICLSCLSELFWATIFSCTSSSHSWLLRPSLLLPNHFPFVMG